MADFLRSGYHLRHNSLARYPYLQRAAAAVHSPSSSGPSEGERSQPPSQVLRPDAGSGADGGEASTPDSATCLSSQFSACHNCSSCWEMSRLPEGKFFSLTQGKAAFPFHKSNPFTPPRAGFFIPNLKSLTNETKLCQSGEGASAKLWCHKSGVTFQGGHGLCLLHTRVCHPRLSLRLQKWGPWTRAGSHRCRRRRRRRASSSSHITAALMTPFPPWLACTFLSITFLPR